MRGDIRHLAIAVLTVAGLCSGAGAEEAFDLTAALRRGGESLTADRAAELALQTAPELTAARAAERSAREAAWQAYLATYPRLDLSARYTRLKTQDSRIPFVVRTSEIPVPPFMDSEIIIPAEAEFELADEIYGTRAEVRYPVSDLFLSILPSYRAALRLADAQSYEVEARRRTVALRARESFYRYAMVRAASFVAEAGLAAAEAHRGDVSAMVKVGELARVELLRADARVASAGVSVARSRGAEARARTALGTILHRELSDSVAIEEDLLVPPELPADGTAELLAAAREQRPEVLALRETMRAHEHAIRSSAGARLPHLSLSGSFDYAEPSPELFALEDEAGTSWTFGAALTWSPNDMLDSDSRKRQAESDLARAKADLSALDDALRVEVSESFEDYLASRAAMRAALAGIEAAEEGYRIRREQFKAAATTTATVLDAESELRRARLDLIDAAIGVRIARARLGRAIGEN